MTPLFVAAVLLLASAEGIANKRHASLEPKEGFNTVHGTHFAGAGAGAGYASVCSLCAQGAHDHKAHAGIPSLGGSYSLGGAGSHAGSFAGSQAGSYSLGGSRTQTSHTGVQAPCQSGGCSPIGFAHFGLPTGFQFAEDIFKHIPQETYWWQAPDSPFKMVQDFYQKCAEGKCHEFPGFNFQQFHGKLPENGCNANGCSFSGSFHHGQAGPMDLSKNPFLNGEYNSIKISSCAGSACPDGKPQTTITTCKGKECKTHQAPGEISLSTNPFLGGFAGSFAGTTGGGVQATVVHGGVQPSFGQPQGSNQQPTKGGSYGQSQGSQQSHHLQGGSQSSYGQSQGSQQSHHLQGSSQSSYGQQPYPQEGSQPSRHPQGGSQPSYGQTHPQEGPHHPQGGSKPSYGQQPQEGSQPSGHPQGGSQPSYGQQPQQSHHLQGGSQPSYGQQPQGGSQPSGHPQGGSQPSYGQEGSQPSRYPQGGSQPSYGQEGSQPSRHPQGGSQPSYGQTPGSQPSYEQTHPQPGASQPSYSQTRPQGGSEPSYGQQPTKGGQPGKPYTSQGSPTPSTHQGKPFTSAPDRSHTPQGSLFTSGPQQPFTSGQKPYTSGPQKPYTSGAQQPFTSQGIPTAVPSPASYQCGEGYTCVQTYLCVNGFVAGGNALARSNKPTCDSGAEVCCKLPQSGYAVQSSNSASSSSSSSSSASSQASGVFTSYTSGTGFPQSQAFPGRAGTSPGILHIVPDGQQAGDLNELGQPTIKNNAYLPPVDKKPPNVYTPDLAPPRVKPNIPYQPQSSNPDQEIYIPRHTTAQTPKPYVTTPYVHPTTTPRPYTPYVPPQPQYRPEPSNTFNNGYLPPIDESPSNVRPYKEKPTTEKNTYLPPRVPDSDIINVNVIKPPEDNRPDADNPFGSVLKPPTQRPSTQYPFGGDLNTTPYPGCAAALKCVKPEFCTADGVMSETPVVITKEQSHSRVPLTSCTDLETGIIGKCCRDPKYKDPWPASQLGLYNPDNGFDNGQYRKNGDGGKYKKPPTKTGTPQRPFGPNPEGSPSNTGGTFLRPGGYPSNVPTIPFDSRQINKPFLVDVNGPIEVNLEHKPSSSNNKLSSGTCGTRNKDTRPVGPGPYDANFAEIPWQAMVLRDTNRSLLCGGVIVKPDVVLTAAHCVEDLLAGDVLVKGGEWKLGIDEEPKPFQIIKVQTIIRHPGYVPETRLNDIAILKLEERFRRDKNVDTICLPAPGEDVQASFQGARCITTGWGKTVLQIHLLNALMHILDTTVIPVGQCQNQLQQNYPEQAHLFNTNCFCGAPVQPNTDLCDVDIGSAMVCDRGDGRYTLAGIYSWDTGCGSYPQVAAFQKVDLGWVESQLSRPVKDLKQEEQGFFAKLHRHTPDCLCEGK